MPGSAATFTACSYTLRSMSHVYHGLRPPAAVVARDAKRRVGGALHFHRRMVPRDVHLLAPGRAGEPAAPDAHPEARKEHLAGGHLVDERVQPLGKKQLVVRRLALD